MRSIINKINYIFVLKKFYILILLYKSSLKKYTDPIIINLPLLNLYTFLIISVVIFSMVFHNPPLSGNVMKLSNRQYYF